MTGRKSHLWHLLPAALWLLAGCAVIDAIDDDLSDCPPEKQEEERYELDYELRLVTNMTTELHTELNTQTDIAVAQALQSYLSGIFTDFAHDVDLSFYDTQGDSLRLQHDQHLMDANQASYTLNLPRRQYMHLAVANIVDNAAVSLGSDDYCHAARLQLESLDTIDSQPNGVFTARLPMNVLEGVNQSFNVHLYMANCAAVMVIDTVGSGIRDLQVFTTGFATGFRVADSAFVYSALTPIVRSVEVPVPGSGQQAFCSVSLPSREFSAAGAARAGTRTIIETTDPFVTTDADERIWEYRVYATTASGTRTESIVYVQSPLRAGQLKVVKARVSRSGSLDSEDQTVAISVTLDWRPGGSHVVPL